MLLRAAPIFSRRSVDISVKVRAWFPPKLPPGSFANVWAQELSGRPSAPICQTSQCYRPSALYDASLGLVWSLRCPLLLGVGSARRRRARRGAKYIYSQHFNSITTIIITIPNDFSLGVGARPTGDENEYAFGVWSRPGRRRKDAMSLLIFFFFIKDEM